VGLEDVSKYPALFAVLIERGFSDNDVKKIARHNIVRVFKAVEKVSGSVLQKTRARIT
jgi:membrane dipeptidase